jgi:hypothetical protein
MLYEIQNHIKAKNFQINVPQKNDQKNVPQKISIN